MKEIKRALISVYYKDGLEEIVKILAENNVEILGPDYGFYRKIANKIEFFDILDDG